MTFYVATEIKDKAETLEETKKSLEKDKAELKNKKEEISGSRKAKEENICAYSIVEA